MIHDIFVSSMAKPDPAAAAYVDAISNDARLIRS